MRIWRSALPPAGTSITLDDAYPVPEFPGYCAYFVNSGTAALALAMRCAARYAQRTRPEVVLPAYGCPALVAAAEHAGSLPVLADLEPAHPVYSQSALADAMGPETAAVVAVNFLGIKERLPDLRQRCDDTGTLLIEDDAQWFPETPNDLRGDLVCLSFGRGKPVTLLGGGALLVRTSLLPRVGGLLADIEPVGRARGLAWHARAYNALLHPPLYAAVERNPLLKLGRTVYTPLERITAMSPERVALLGANVAALQRKPRVIEVALSHALRELPSELVLDVAAAADTRAGRLLRYPILLRDRVIRDRVLGTMRRLGLGATSMYEKALSDIPGVRERLSKPSTHPNAAAFAERLLTLPTHDGVQRRAVADMLEILRTEMT